MVKENPDFELSPSEKARLGSLWAKAITEEEGTPEEQDKLALAFGANFRLNLAQAFKAAWETSKATIKGIAAAHAPFAIWVWLEVGAEAASAVHTIFVSLVETMAPIDYITAVILSQHPEGIVKEKLKTEVVNFLQNPKAADYAWYFGMSGKKVERAQEAAKTVSWFETTVGELRRREFLEGDGTVVFKKRDFEIGWKSL